MPDHYFAIYKPFGILSQFRTNIPAESLKTVYDFPKHVYPVGRLDKDSEGLLLLTSDKALTNKLLEPSKGHRRRYLVQVEGDPTEEQLQELRKGVNIRIKGSDYRTCPCKVKKLEAEPPLPPREPPIRYRKEIPTTWLELELTEGKNRQVRKMTAAVGLPTLRLVRWSIERIDIRGMEVGDVLILEKRDVYWDLFKERA
jgi:23S rRNA pseudouridine2457 synthase